MSERRRRAPVPAVMALVALVASGVLAVTVFAATPDEGTVSLENPRLAQPWEGETFALGATMDPALCEPEGVDADVTCDTFTLTVDIPASHWESNRGGVDVRVEPDPESASPGNDDFDIHIYNAAGDEVASGESTGGVTERAFIADADADAGPYRVEVNPYAVSNSKYFGGAFVESRPIANGGAEVPTEGRVTNAECPESGTGRAAGIFPCDDVDLDSFLSIPEISMDEEPTELLNDIWGWTDEDGEEYALIGKTNGTAFVRVTDEADPVYLGDLPTNTPVETIFNSWRDIKVFDDHAYIGSEEPAHGMQVFDLRRLREVTEAQEWTEDANYSFVVDGPESLLDLPDAADRTPLLTGDNSHNLAINEESGTAYAIGTSTCAGGGAHMIDLGDPTGADDADPKPTFAGCISDDSYTHDTQCVNYEGPDSEHAGDEICLSSNEDSLTIHKVLPPEEEGGTRETEMLSKTEYEGSEYTHQGWLTSDGRHFLVGDELDEQADPGIPVRTLIFDVSDLDGSGELPMGEEAPPLAAPRVFEGRTESIDHNLYTVDDPETFENTVFQSNYRSGLRVLDSARIARGNGLRETGCFDVFPADNQPEFNGSWSNYPYFESGNVIATGIEQGLFVLSPDPDDSDDSTGCPDDSAAASDTASGGGSRGDGTTTGGATGRSSATGCFTAATQARAKRLGRAGLGNRRSNVRRTFGAEGRYRRFLDRYCLADASTIRVGYPSPKQMRQLASGERTRLRGKASLVLTSSRRSAVRGINVGDSVAELQRRTGNRRGVRVGGNVWFVRRGERAGQVFKVQNGVVREVGLADRRQTATSARVKRFFTSGR